MTTASVRDLRTRFPVVRQLIEKEGEVVVTERGRPAFVLRPFQARAAGSHARVDYYARLNRRMPRPLTAAQREGLEEADRAER